ncbi:MAG: hypothetical protein KIS77_21195 [Saprospiraceae bacterium]|nr:hypothetical protein [Saprospiraceae bacterium]
MERLLSILFSVTLLLATMPPKVGGDCFYWGGICVVQESCAADAAASCAADHSKDGDKAPVCPAPICCVAGPCCCLCLMPETPLLPSVVLPTERSARVFACAVFLPQQVWLSVWKPPAFSV